MRPFGWKKWWSLFGRFKQSKRPSIERWGLAYLHSKYALDELALSVAQMLGKKGKMCSVSAESIWIDGTPQAEVEILSRKIIKCELADLLFIVEEIYQGNSHKYESGVLIQGKATSIYNQLPPGGSTKKERQLLEDMNRAKPLTLYKGTSSLSSKIGTYSLSGIPVGLSDCSRYLLMPKAIRWVHPILKLYAPFQVGWPISRHSSFLYKPKSIVQSIQEMVLFKTIGKPIVDPSKCEWSRMVNDLRGGYQGICMRGYNGQSRVNHSSRMMAFMSEQYFSNFPHGAMPPDQPPTEGIISDENEIPPNIPIVKVTIQHFNDDFYNRGKDA